MMFRVKTGTVTDNSSLPSVLRTVERYNPAAAVQMRDVTIEHLDDESGDPIAFLLDGKFRHECVTEISKAGTIEVWNLINLTSETHPIHLHLSDFQVLNRQEIDAEAYHEAVMAYRHGQGPKPNLNDFLDGTVVPPTKSERGNKDTVQAHASAVTRIVVKFGEYTGMTVWHCHILEHEDNDMMRPLLVIPAWANPPMNPCHQH